VLWNQLITIIPISEITVKKVIVGTCIASMQIQVRDLSLYADEAILNVIKLNPPNESTTQI